LLRNENGQNSNFLIFNYLEALKESYDATIPLYKYCYGLRREISTHSDVKCAQKCKMDSSCEAWQFRDNQCWKGIPTKCISPRF
jgi:hypothetical protein